MRGDTISLTALLIATKGEYGSENVEFMGWYSTTVLLICLPVFLTFLAYAGILFYEVATKKEFISSRPLTISTTTSKYVDTGAPQGAQGAGTLANPPGTNYPAPGAGHLGHQPVDLGSNPQTSPPVIGGPGIVAAPVAVEKDTTVELYLWEELLLFMVFHLVGLVFCIQPCLTKRNHNAVGIVVAWLHLPYICGYAFVAVLYSLLR